MSFLILFSLNLFAQITWHDFHGICSATTEMYHTQLLKSVLVNRGRENSYNLELCRLPSDELSDEARVTRWVVETFKQLDKKIKHEWDFSVAPVDIEIEPIIVTRLGTKEVFAADSLSYDYERSTIVLLPYNHSLIASGQVPWNSKLTLAHEYGHHHLVNVFPASVAFYNDVEMSQDKRLLGQGWHEAFADLFAFLTFDQELNLDLFLDFRDTRNILVNHFQNSAKKSIQDLTQAFLGSRKLHEINYNIPHNIGSVLAHHFFIKHRYLVDQREILLRFSLKGEQCFENDDLQVSGLIACLVE